MFTTIGLVFVQFRWDFVVAWILFRGGDLDTKRCTYRGDDWRQSKDTVYKPRTAQSCGRLGRAWHRPFLKIPKQPTAVVIFILDSKRLKPRGHSVLPFGHLVSSTVLWKPLPPKTNTTRWQGLLYVTEDITSGKSDMSAIYSVYEVRGSF